MFSGEKIFVTINLNGGITGVQGVINAGCIINYDPNLFDPDADPILPNTQVDAENGNLFQGTPSVAASIAKDGGGVEIPGKIVVAVADNVNPPSLGAGVAAEVVNIAFTAKQVITPVSATFNIDPAGREVRTINGVVAGTSWNEISPQITVEPIPEAPVASINFKFSR